MLKKLSSDPLAGYKNPMLRAVQVTAVKHYRSFLPTLQLLAGMIKYSESRALTINLEHHNTAVFQKMDSNGKYSLETLLPSGMSVPHQMRKRQQKFTIVKRSCKTGLPQKLISHIPRRKLSI